jgi:hypothetical protein
MTLVVAGLLLSTASTGKPYGAYPLGGKGKVLIHYVWPLFFIRIRATLRLSEERNALMYVNPETTVDFPISHLEAAALADFLEANLDTVVHDDDRANIGAVYARLRLTFGD